MASRTLPGIGLNGDWDLGEDGWKDGTDENWLKLSALVRTRVLARVTALPGSPSDGDIYILVDDESSEHNNICVRDDGAWVYFEPAKGWKVWDVDADTEIMFDPTGGEGGEPAWVEASSGGGGAITITREVFTAAGAHTWNKPAGLMYADVEVQAGGGGGARPGSGGGGSGGSSSFGSLLTATGGTGGNNNGGVSAGGSALGGDVNISGAAGEAGTTGTDTIPGRGGGAKAGVPSRNTGGPTSGSMGSGGGGHTNGSGGGEGGFCRKMISAGDLSATETVVVGGGGSGVNGSGAGGTGYVIVTNYIQGA